MAVGALAVVRGVVDAAVDGCAPEDTIALGLVTAAFTP